MPTVSEQLRQAREAQDLTVYQVAEVTKIKTDHVRALEQGDYEVFSAPVYIRGFVRSYATMLKLDVQQVMTDLELELAKTEKFREPPSLPGGSRGVLDYLMLQFSKANWWIILWIFLIGVCLALASLGLRAWQEYQSRDHLRDLGPGLYKTPSGGGSETLPLPTNSSPAQRSR